MVCKMGCDHSLEDCLCRCISCRLELEGISEDLEFEMEAEDE